MVLQENGADRSPPVENATMTFAEGERCPVRRPDHGASLHEQRNVCEQRPRLVLLCRSHRDLESTFKTPSYLYSCDNVSFYALSPLLGTGQRVSFPSFLTSHSTQG